jgi:hypothetical protein
MTTQVEGRNGPDRLSEAAPAMFHITRDTTPLTVNNDSFSGSTLTSVVLIQPPNGWKTKVIETEYLCFYDSTTWAAADRAQLKLPAGCKAS